MYIVRKREKKTAAHLILIVQLDDMDVYMKTAFYKQSDRDIRI